MTGCTFSYPRYYSQQYHGRRTDLEHRIIPAFSRRRKARSVAPQVGAQAEAADGPVLCPVATPGIELLSALPSNPAASSFGTCDAPTVRDAAPVATGSAVRIRTKRERPGLKWRRRVRERCRLVVLLKRQGNRDTEVKVGAEAQPQGEMVAVEAETPMYMDVEAKAEVGGEMDVDAWGEVEVVAFVDVDVDMEAFAELDAEAEAFAEEMDVDEGVGVEAEAEAEVEGGVEAVGAEPEVDVEIGVDMEGDAAEEEVETPGVGEVEVVEVKVEVEAEASAAAAEGAVAESGGEVEVQTGGRGEAELEEEIEVKIEGDAKVEEAEPQAAPEREEEGPEVEARRELEVVAVGEAALGEAMAAAEEEVAVKTGGEAEVGVGGEATPEVKVAVCGKVVAVAEVEAEVKTREEAEVMVGSEVGGEVAEPEAEVGVQVGTAGARVEEVGAVGPAVPAGSAVEQVCQFPFHALPSPPPGFRNWYTNYLDYQADPRPVGAQALGEAAEPERTPFVFIPEDHPRIAWALDPNWPRGPAGQGSVTTTQVPVAPGTVGPEEEAAAQVVEVAVEEVVVEEEAVAVEEAVEVVEGEMEVVRKARWLRYLWSFFPLGLLLWSFFPMSLLCLAVALAPQAKEAGKWLEEEVGDLGRVLNGWWWGVRGRFLRTWVLLAMAVEVGSGRAIDWVEEKVGELGEVLEGRLGWVVEGLFHIVWWTLLGSAVFGNLLAPASGYHQFMGLVPSAEETALRHGRPEVALSPHLGDSVLAWETLGVWWYAIVSG